MTVFWSRPVPRRSATSNFLFLREMAKMQGYAKITLSNAKLFSILANATRLKVLDVLAREGEMSVGNLTRETGMSQSALSQHLSKMRIAGIVSTRREAQTVYYYSEHAVAREILACLNRINSEYNHQKAS